jgi:DNA excision repair protein ERCC-3
MIGPKLYEENLVDLMNEGFLARPYIVEVLCEMSPIFKQEYTSRPNQIKSLLHTGNPSKFLALQFLIKQHEMLGHKILVFCDSLLILNHYA